MLAVHKSSAAKSSFVLPKKKKKRGKSQSASNKEGKSQFGFTDWSTLDDKEFTIKLNSISFPLDSSNIVF